MQLITMRLMTTMVVIGSISLLSGCATLSKQECMVGDWQAIGYNDGVAGYSVERLASHSKACAKVSVAPDYQAWERGRELGLQQYCTADSAYNVGRRGNALNNVCPASMMSSLRKINQQGQQYYTFINEIEKDKQLIKTYRAEYDKLRNGDMLDFETEKEARTRLLYLPKELYKIQRRIDNNERKIELLDQTSPYL